MPFPDSKPAALGRQPSLDGIRGVAILAVLAIHFDWAWLPGGFLGVDIFFTLSGFLITTLLLEEFAVAGHISLHRFFIRRCLRLYPALVALVVVSTAYTIRFHSETSIYSILTIDAGVLTYVSNWQILAESLKEWYGGMWHTWTLSIEAQFYMFWSLIVAYTSRRLNSAGDRPMLIKTLSIFALFLAFLSAGWRAILWYKGADWLRMYLSTDTRMDGVMIGAILALYRLKCVSSPSSNWVSSSRSGLISVFEVACAGAIGLLLFLLPWHAGLPGMSAFTITSVATAGLIISTTMRNDTLFSFLLRLRVLRWFGLISYSLYIWHVPAARVVSSSRLMAAGAPYLLAECIRFGVTVFIAIAFYRLIEKPFLRLKYRFDVV
jgi:peptidoglycan/LPS O-acetylase OafA/YrhL